MAIEKEKWIALLKEDFIPDASFLARSVDMSEFVDYNKINLAEAGVDPKVLVDNAVYPIPASQREDIPLEIPLHTLDTENTIVRNVEEKESSYKKMKSVVRGHKKALLTKCATMAAHSWAPNVDAALAPVRFAGGAPDSAGRRSLSFEDVLRLRNWYTGHDIPLESLVLVLNADHQTDLMVEDLKQYKAAMEARNLFGIDYYVSSTMPYYESATGTKKALGAATIVGDTQASLMYCDTEVMRALGTTEMFAKYKDPEQRGDMIGFQQRFTAMPIRGKYTAALVSQVK